MRGNALLATTPQLTAALHPWRKRREERRKRQRKKVAVNTQGRPVAFFPYRGALWPFVSAEGSAPVAVAAASDSSQEMEDAPGLESDGRGFSNDREMWREGIGVGEEGEAGEESSHPKRREWYRKGIAYWQGVEASVDGVLGGYGHVNEADVKGSEAFLKPLLIDRFGSGPRRLVPLDCGSGIGRVAKNLLLRYFNEVDLVEPVSHFLEAARKKLAHDEDKENSAHKAVNFYCVPLQEFTPEVGRYNVIWIQWCIGQLPDDDFLSFFKRAKVGLKPHGFFVVKENTTTKGFVLDREDNSITRSDLYFKELFKKCGLYLYRTKDQKGFPEELFPVKMYALVPDNPKDEWLQRQDFHISLLSSSREAPEHQSSVLRPSIEFAVRLAATGAVFV